MSNQRIIGYTIKCETLTHDTPELRERMENLAGEAFEATYGFPPTDDRVWIYDQGGPYEDENGEVWEMPPQWMLLVEAPEPKENTDV